MNSMEKLLSSCQSIKGNYRKKNQDRAVCMIADRSDCLFAVACVCDGIGSFEMSELASELVTNGVRNWFLHLVDKVHTLSQKELLDDMEETLYELNELVCEYQEGHRMTIGCTMSLLLIFDMKFFVFHVGDSRVCVVKDGMHQLTVDEVIHKKTDGKIQSYLSNHIGKTRNLWLNKSEGVLHQGILFVLGTDGLFKNLRYDDFDVQHMKLHSQKEIEALNHRIIQFVLARGERDNISCILLYVHFI